MLTDHADRRRRALAATVASPGIGRRDVFVGLCEITTMVARFVALTYTAYLPMAEA